MGVYPTLQSSERSPDLEAMQNNTAYAYLATQGVVMVMLLLSPDAPDELADAMVPPMFSSSVVRRCWPDPRPQCFPLGVLPEADLAAFIEGAPKVFSGMSLPVAGLIDTDAAAVMEEFLSGADLADLRRRWQMP